MQLKRATILLKASICCSLGCFFIIIVTTALFLQTRQENGRGQSVLGCKIQKRNPESRNLERAAARRATAKMCSLGPKG